MNPSDTASIAAKNENKRYISIHISCTLDLPLIGWYLMRVPNAGVGAMWDVADQATHPCLSFAFLTLPQTFPIWQRKTDRGCGGFAQRKLLHDVGTLQWNTDFSHMDTDVF
jgi:hypothetical protein